MKGIILLLKIFDIGTHVLMLAKLRQTSPESIKMPTDEHDDIKLPWHCSLRKLINNVQFTDQFLPNRCYVVNINLKKIKIVRKIENNLIFTHLLRVDKAICGGAHDSISLINLFGDNQFK